MLNMIYKYIAGMIYIDLQPAPVNQTGIIHQILYPPAQLSHSISSECSLTLSKYHGFLFLQPSHLHNVKIYERDFTFQIKECNSILIL